MGPGSRRLACGAAIAAALAVAACGEEDFVNAPRPSSAIGLAARIGDRDISVSPSSAAAVGAGLATITISNQSSDPATLTLEGPTDEASGEIPAGGIGKMQIVLDQGEYTVSAGEDSDARETELAVGAERKSSENELLQP